MILALKVLQKTCHKVPLRLYVPSPRSSFDFDPLLSSCLLNFQKGTLKTCHKAAGLFRISSLMLLLLCVKRSLAGCGSRRSRKPRQKENGGKVKVWTRCLSPTRWGHVDGRGLQPSFLPSALAAGL